MEVPKNFKAWLSLEGWASDKLLALAQQFGIEIPHNNFVQCKISLGKVEWRVYVSEIDAWFAPEKGAGSTQHLKQIKPPLDQSTGNFVNMTFQDFVIFKNAGKRARPDKYTSSSTKLLFSRVGRDKEAKKIPPALFDVGKYSVLTLEDYSKKCKGLNMDHIPQDKWVLKVYYDYLKVELVAKTLSCVVYDQNIDPSSFKKQVKANNQLLVSERMRNFFPVLRQTGFQEALTYIDTNKRLTDTCRNQLATIIQKFSHQISSSYLSSSLDNYKATVKANGLAIAVTEDMHKHSRTFWQNGRVTKERILQSNSVLAETLLDHRHYHAEVFRQIYGKPFEEDLVAIGAFRYHYRQTIKAFDISQNEIIQSGYDQELTTYLRRWSELHQTGKT